MTFRSTFVSKQCAGVTFQFNHSLACFAILGGDVSDVRSAVENKYMVPSLAVNISGAAKVITNWVRSTLAACEKKYSVLAEGYEGTGIR